MLALVAAAAPLQGQGKPAEVLRFGSWNIEHLGDPDSRRGSAFDDEKKKGIQQKPADLARYIRYARADVLALQEIKADGDAPAGFPKQYRTNSILTKVFDELNKTPGNDWKHILFPKSTGDNRQWTGVAWKASKVKPVGDIYRLPLSHARTRQGNAMWDRNLHALKFSAGKGRTDFLVLVLHLKANTVASFAAHREEEARELAAKLPLLDKAFPGERDIILVGDTNTLDGKEEMLAVLEGKDFRDLNKDDHDTHFAKGTQPFDRVFVPKKQPEFAASRLEVLSEFQKKERLSFSEYRQRYSDHYMIATELRVMADDD
jgi:endonuclease/exonuclease/phosphatase family metal-dependent hydrolase